MGFSTVPCNEFVEVLGSKAPVPGGGGASALVGAVGTALGNMVGALTVGKKKYADVEEEMKELMAKATHASGRTASPDRARCRSVRTALQSIRHAARDRGGEGRKSKSHGDCAEGCLLCSNGNYGKMLRSNRPDRRICSKRFCTCDQ